MALTPQEITFYAGDTRTVDIPLKNDSDASAFTPTGYNLIFTAKASNAASDNGAKFQYSTGAGITHSTTNASTVFHPVDTRAHGGKTLYWDIQAEHLTNPDDVRTVAYGTLVLKRDTTRQTTTSVPLHTLSEAVPYTGPTGETPLITSTTPPSDHDAIWFDPETGGFSVWYVDAWVAVGEGGAGGPPTAAEITAALQGVEADATKIGAEYMPSALVLDYVVIGEAGVEAELPEGGLARVDGNLVMFDSLGNAIPVGGSAQENLVPYHRTGGVTTVIPYGVTNSTAKVASTQYWQEIARVRVPASEIANGNVLHLAANILMESAVAIPVSKNVMRIAPAEEWDAALGASFQSVTPIGRMSFSTGTQAVTTCKKSVTQFLRSHAMVKSSNNLAISNSAAGTSSSGYDLTNEATFTGTSIQGHLNFTKADSTDLELVLIACVTANSSDFRSYGYTFSAYATAP